MKLSLLVAMLALSSAAMADQYVQPYVKSDGTYVEGHYRSDPNATRNDNYSTKGNTNPYTGKQGTKQGDDAYKPYQMPNPYESQPRR